MKRILFIEKVIEISFLILLISDKFYYAEINLIYNIIPHIFNLYI